MYGTPIQCQTCRKTGDASSLCGDNLPWSCTYCGSRHEVSISMTLVTGLRLIDRFPMPQGLICSPAVLRSLQDAIRCFNSGVPRAALVMVRLALESACDDLSAKGDKLFQKVNNLADTGVFDKGMVHAATAMRLFGNDGAHSGDDLSDENAESMAEYALKMAIDLIRKVTKLPAVTQPPKLLRPVLPNTDASRSRAKPSEH